LREKRQSPAFIASTSHTSSSKSACDASTRSSLAGAIEVQPCSPLEGMVWKLDLPEGEGSK
jgi:hypothetical protein